MQNSQGSRRKQSNARGSLINYANSDDSYNVKAILYDDHTLNIIDMQNSKQYTLMHLSCYNNNEELSELYIQYLQAQCDKKMITRSQITEWLNMQNDEGFTALHLAAYRGSLKTIQQLEDYQADYTIKNFNDLSVLHTSAQGDSPLTIYYYITKNIDINISDNKGSTPLHWASYSGSFNAVNFLLSWGANINIQDNDTGVTALHLATMQGNSRIVRKLLMKGIDRNLKDFSGKTALDLAIDADFQTIAKMIKDKIGILEYCNVRQPFRPVEKKQRSLIAFLIMYLTQFILTIIFTFPFVIDTAWLWAFTILTGLTVVYFLISWLKDPGTVKGDPKLDMLTILQRYDCNQICADCKLVRPKRSKHCDVCGQCIMVYDHHCPWINNCIGAKNHFIFYFFILSLSLEFILQIVMQILHFNQNTAVRMYSTTNHWLIVGKYVTFAYVMFYCICFSVPVGILLYIQTMNLLSGQTTFERHSIGAKKKEEEEESNENTSLSCQNCFDMCFQNRKKSEYSTDDNLIEL